MFEFFEHTADLGLRVRAPNLEALFAEAAQALFSILVANLDDVKPRDSKTVEIKGRSLDYLLFDWLHELLYEFESRRILFSEFEVHLEAGGLRATARGEPMDPARHQMEHEVKAITYHGLKVEQQAEVWLAEVIVDI